MPDKLSDDHIMQSIQASAEETVAFSAMSKGGYERLRASMGSRGDPFDRCSQIVLEEEGREVLRIPVSCMPATIGSGTQVDYVLNRSGISRLHCHLEYVGGLVRLHDDASVNGVELNKKSIRSEDLCDGDEVMLGSVLLRIRKV